MGWIEQGSLRIYSISDTIGQFTKIMFTTIRNLFTNGFVQFIMILFFLSLLFYFWTIIHIKLRDFDISGQ